ncbi:MAG TPA: AAA family ATPase [Gaiellaceae bacterium]|nr:AAA family ATPase [Gaiellaceae bacterium]
MIVCPQCGAENRDEARFCDSCGAALTPEDVSPREERKVVTVLFADLVGFTSRAERMDPEDVRAVLEPYHARLRGELERYGGTVEKFIGDAVMALFGAPVAHEDDPERAVRAALIIRDWAREQEDLQLRIAVTTGEALVALGARPEEGEGMASGDVVNTAARLQSAAPVNSILVDETTYRATGPVISYADHAAVQTKDKAAPIPVWEALEARSRLGVDLPRGSGAPLVGREEELDLLRNSLTRSRQEQAPQLVTLVGVPGIGKSRLVAELFGIVEADPDFISWRQGRCLPYGEGVTYWALSEMVKAQSGILETDSEEEAGQKLRAGVAEALPEAADATWVEGHLRPLIGLAEDTQAHGGRQAEAYAAWRRFFEGLAEQRPLVLIFEDLHWADESLLDFIDHLVDWATGVPLLVVCTARPELLSRRAGWGGGKTNAATISLSPLSGEETARLVHALLERSVLPADIQATLIERAGGNPLYAEEFARMVDELDAAEDEEIRLPESVQGIIAARLDALPLEEKLLLQDAAVVGKVFWLGTLERIGQRDRAGAEQLLHALERKDFVRRERRSSVGDETQYAFRHLLVRDVAYSQIPRAARADKHRGAAEWIEALGRPEDHAEMLAHHYLSCLEYAAAAGKELPEVAERARLALRAAGDRALALSSYTAASRFYDSALELWPADDPDRAYVLLGYGRARKEAEVEGADLLAEAGAALEEADPKAAAQAEIALADLFWRRGQHVESAHHRERAASLIDGAEPSRSTAYVLAELARFHMLAAEGEEAIRFGEQALSMAERLELDDVRGVLLNTLGAIRAMGGDPRGLQQLEEAVVISRALNTTELTRALNNLAHNLIHWGDFRAAEPIVEEMNEIADRFGYRDWIRWGRDKKLNLGYHLGRWDEAWELAGELVREVDSGTPHYLAGEWRMFRGRIQVARGDRAAASAEARKGLEEAREAGDVQIVAPLLAWNALLLGGSTDGRALFDELMEIWRRLGNMVHGPPTTAPDTAAVALNLGREQEFIDAAAVSTGGEAWLRAGVAYVSGEFSHAADLYAEMGTVPGEADARLRAAEQLVKAGQRAKAEPELQRALALWRSVGATAYVREGEALLAASA